MLRVNLSVAIVAMTANRTHTEDNGTIAVVSIVTVCKKKILSHKKFREINLHFDLL